MRLLRWSASAASAAVLVACGGGGGGEPVQPVRYTGSTAPAVVSPTNAAALLACMPSTPATAIDVVGGGAAPVATGRARPLAARATVQAVEVDETEACDNGVGTLRTRGQIDETRLTGTLTLTFSGCLMGSKTFDGSATLRIDAYDGRPTDFTLGFDRLSIRGPSVAVDAGGSIRMQALGNTETMTLNLVTVDQRASRSTRSEGLVFAATVDPVDGSGSAQVHGRLYDSVHGYVDVTTPTPLHFSTPTQPTPDGGRLLLAGGTDQRIRATVVSAAVVRLELATTAAGFPFGKAALVAWTDLAGPAAADLRDSDGDGMHDSWETAHGLNPASPADAAADADGDGTTNLREYQVGADPRRAGPVPAVAPTLEDAPFLAAPASQAAGGSPGALVIADFDGDGVADLVAAHPNDGTVTLFRGDGAGGFAPASTVATGPLPRALAVADFDGDGRPDLAVANFGGPSVSVLLGRGDGFAPAVEWALESPLNPTAVVAGDFDGDGRADLALTLAYGFSNATPGRVVVLRGDGLGGFAAPVSHAVGGSPVALAAGDFNGDGHLDLASANELGGTLSLLTGDGTGAFAPAVERAVDGRPLALAVADFNGDGWPDLAVAVGAPVINAAHVAVLPGRGAGGLGPAVTQSLDHAGGAVPTGLAVADVDGDGRPDLAVGDAARPRALVLLGDGAGSFGTANYALALGGTPVAVAAARLDPGVRADLVAAWGSGTPAGWVSVALGTAP